jgi:NitT/TauT family transport system substrate-binding protein
MSHKRNKVAVAGVAILAILVVVAVYSAPAVAATSPSASSSASPSAPAVTTASQSASSPASLAGPNVVSAKAAAVKGKGIPVKVGYLPVTGHAKFFIAYDQGFFAEEGLDVELVEFINSADGLNALRAGKLDLGAFGTTAPLVHISKGADLRIIGGVMGEDAAIIATAANAATIKGVADLKGKKVATVRLATGDAVFRGALKAVGLDWKKDVEIFELKNPPAVIESVKSGQVDAGVVWGPHDIRATEQGLVIVCYSGQLQPGHPCCRLTINGKDADKGEQWEKFLRAILKAEKFAKTNKEATLDAIVNHVKIDRSLAERGYYSPHLDQSSDANLKGVKLFWETMKASGFIESDADIAKYVQSDYYNKALASLVAKEPAETYWTNLQKVAAERD